MQSKIKIGYNPGNAKDANRYQAFNTICEQVGDPTRWSHHVKDQTIVIGWARYDEKTGCVPPEHWLGHALRETLTESCRSGILAGEGPDDKLLVRLRRNHDDRSVEHILHPATARADPSG